MTKKALSRVFAAVLVLSLLVALAVPGFAAAAFSAPLWPDVNIMGPWSFANVASGYQRINIYRSYAGNLNRSYEKVRMYSSTASPDQMWIFPLAIGSSQQITSKVKGMNGENISLNKTLSGDCIVFASAGNEIDSMAQCDGSMQFEMVYHRGLYLKSNGANGNVFWGTNPSNYSVWSAYRV